MLTLSLVILINSIFGTFFGGPQIIFLHGRRWIILSSTRFLSSGTPKGETPHLPSLSVINPLLCFMSIIKFKFQHNWKVTCINLAIGLEIYTGHTDAFTAFKDGVHKPKYNSVFLNQLKKILPIKQDTGGKHECNKSCFCYDMLAYEALDFTP